MDRREQVINPVISKAIDEELRRLDDKLLEIQRQRIRLHQFRRLIPDIGRDAARAQDDPHGEALYCECRSHAQVIMKWCADRGMRLTSVLASRFPEHWVV